MQCWGRNYESQLGLGPSNRNLNNRPTTVPNLTGVHAATAGNETTCAIVDSGVKCWGSTNTSESTVNQTFAGNGTTWGAFSPVDVSGIGRNARSVASGFNQSCVAIDTGAVKCWGRNDRQSLGVGDSDFFRRELAPVNTSIASGALHVVGSDTSYCALMDDGKVKCWGDNSSKQLGRLGSSTEATPVDLPLSAPAVAVAVGGTHVCVVLNTGAVQCLGDDRVTPTTAVPTNVPGNLALGLTLKMVEYVIPSLNYYFLTSRHNEKVLLDGVSAFQRTNKSFAVAVAKVAGSVGISRYYFDQVAKSGSRGSHFYTLVASEKTSLDGLNPSNANTPRLPQNEGIDSYAFAPAAEGVGGSCAAGQIPAYRAFRGARFPDDPNHRFTTDKSVYDAAVALGWDGEGVKFCVSAP